VTLAPTVTEEPTPDDTFGDALPAPTGSTGPASPSATASVSSDPEGPSIVLTASASQVASGEDLMLSGTFTQGEGSVLAIWYNPNGTGWKEFNQDANVYGGVFQVFVTTYTPGKIQWRVEDPTTGLKSNEVTVTHGD
jgi:hypothetical protein